VRKPRFGTDRPFFRGFVQWGVEGIRPTPSAAEAARPPRRTPLYAFHRALARPVASLFMALGVPPSIQSLTLTILGVVFIASDRWVHIAQGAGLVYLGFILDRTEGIIWDKKGRPDAWGLYLAHTIDLVQDAALFVGIAIAASTPVIDAPFPAWEPLARPLFVSLSAAAVALFLLARTVATTGSTLLLRQHLLATRRLPGPMALASREPRPFLRRHFGRDELVVVWCLGVLLGQPQATLLLLASLEALLIVESLVLFRRRMKAPEGEAGRVLGPDFP
jgi:hypothetical protein